MGEIYILGGYYEDTCESFDRKSNNKKDIANMNDVRASAASTIYEKKIVISCGLGGLNTFKSYDFMTDT